MDALDTYPSPHVAVDVATLTCRDGALWLLLNPGPGGEGRALPGRFLRPRKRVADGVADVLREKVRVNVDPTRATWLGFFDEPRRDPRGWTISAAFVIGVPWHAAVESAARLERLEGRDVEERGLLYDHDEILRAALESVREEYEQYPDPRGFLDRPFTLSELRQVHEAVLGEPLLRDTFRRRMESLLRPVEGAVAMPAGVGRPAQLYVVERRDNVENPRVKLPRAAGGGRD